MKTPRHALPFAAPSLRINGETIATRLRQVLDGRGLTLSHVSRESRLRYPDDRAYRIPHHFYADLQTEGITPRIEQVLALSAITNYRLVDWLALFGFPIDELPRLAASLPAERTILLDSSVYDDWALVGWFRSKAIPEPLPAIAPLGQFLEPGPPRPLKSLLFQKPSPFLYAKVGRQDAFASPDLLPGSIVRIDTRFLKQPLYSAAPESLFLVEHSKGLACCRLHVSERNKITLRSTELPYAEVALRLGREARVLGKLDFEFRFLAAAPAPVVARELAVFWNPEPLAPMSAKHGFAQFARRARRRAGLSLRDASARSRLVAEALGDGRYFTARGTLSAYETTGLPPRHIHKILGLCAVFSLGFWEVLGAAGWKTDSLGKDPIPPVILGTESALTRNHQTQSAEELDRDFLAAIAKRVEEIPLFLRNSLGPLTELEHISLRDLVWLGGGRSSLHRYLSGALFAAVNRRQRKPPAVGTKRMWEEPLYLLLRRDGSYLCARCTLQDKVLVLPPFADGFEQPVRLRPGVDAEVMGRVVALARRL